MKIIKLESENIKRLRAVQIEPDGTLVVIGGKNGAGKTSVLDSIQYALAGKESLPPEPIRKGEKRASILVDLGDLIVRRIFTERDSRLEITSKDGSVYKSPQSLLDSLTGRLSFDPLEFSRMEPKKQALTLKNLMGLDFSDLDREREQAFNERTMVHREIKALESRIKVLPLREAPAEEISVATLTEEIERRMGINQANALKRREYDFLLNEIKTLEEKIEAIQAELAAKRERLEHLKRTAGDLQKQIDGLFDLDLTSIKEQIIQAEEINQKIHSNRQRKQLESELATKGHEAAALNKKIDEIDEDKKALLSMVEFPVKGLGFDENGVNYNAIRFEQCSSSEQLKVSVAMGLAMNPKLKILLIRDGSLLDEDSLALIAEMAEQADAQVWLERVGEGKEVSVIIEDGSVKGESR